MTVDEALGDLPSNAVPEEWFADARDVLAAEVRRLRERCSSEYARGHDDGWGKIKDQLHRELKPALAKLARVEALPQRLRDQMDALPEDPVNIAVRAVNNHFIRLIEQTLAGDS